MSSRDEICEAAAALADNLLQDGCIAASRWVSLPNGDLVSIRMRKHTPEEVTEAIECIRKQEGK